MKGRCQKKGENEDKAGRNGKDRVNREQQNEEKDGKGAEKFGVVHPLDLGGQTPQGPRAQPLQP